MKIPSNRISRHYIEVAMQKQSTKFRIGPLDPSNYASASMFGLENGTFQSNFFKLFGAFWWTAGIFAAARSPPAPCSAPAHCARRAPQPQHTPK